MEGDQHAVAREMGIGLQVSVPKRHGDLKCRERVLGRLTGTAAVGERDRSRLVKERVHVSQRRIPPSAHEKRAGLRRRPQVSGRGGSFRQRP